MNTNLMVLYFADTNDRSKFACNFSSSFSFFSSVHISNKRLEMLKRVVGLHGSNNCDADENAVFLNFLSIIPSHPVTEK